MQYSYHFTMKVPIYYHLVLRVKVTQWRDRILVRSSKKKISRIRYRNLYLIPGQSSNSLCIYVQGKNVNVEKVSIQKFVFPLRGSFDKGKETTSSRTMQRLVLQNWIASKLYPNSNLNSKLGCEWVVWS